MALNNTGLDWNYAIAPVIDRDLHEKLLDIKSDEVLPFVQLLPLISSGYFGTAIDILERTDTTNSELIVIKDWLISALTEAREV